MTKIGGDIMNIREDTEKLNQQLHEIMIMLKQTIGQQGDTDEPRIKSPPQK
jgi:hypothetical protein